MSKPELPDVGRLQDGRLIWLVVPHSIDDVRVLEGRLWVPARDITVGQILDADGLPEEEVRKLVASGIFEGA